MLSRKHVHAAHSDIRSKTNDLLRQVPVAATDIEYGRTVREKCGYVTRQNAHPALTDVAAVQRTEPLHRRRSPRMLQKKL